MRSNNTNNYLEAQFLVIKDKILDRVKEYNVVGLVNKLPINLDNHYKEKLLSITTGSFDAVYSLRYRGQIKYLPSTAKIDQICSQINVMGPLVNTNMSYGPINFHRIRQTILHVFSSVEN